MGETSADSRRIVIVGGVAGGMSTATRLRRRDEKAEIVVLEKSGYVSFANCGLPYYVGGVIEERGNLLLQTPEALWQRFRIQVRTNTEATSVRAEEKILQVRDVSTGISEEVHYDELVLSPGASPLLPAIPGIERALPLRNVEDTDAMRAAVEEAKAGDCAVVIGGGFIGVEIAENLIHAGLKVTVIERNAHILAPLDKEMAALVQRRLEDNGVTLLTGESVAEITVDAVVLESGEKIPAKIVVAALGVRPETDWLDGSGVEVNGAGAILVDEMLRTNVEHIYALGDAATTRDAIDGSDAVVPLAQTANRHGRLLGDILVGDDVGTRPVHATSILGVCGLQVATTGWNERKLRAAGRDVRVIVTHPVNHAGYYPGAVGLTMKLLVDPQTDAILGAQVIGEEGADKRIDVIATAMQSGVPASGLMDLELAYAPQFGSAKDPVNILGYIADNLKLGRARHVTWNELDERMQYGEATVIDVRTPEEFAAGNIPSAINIPLDAIRQRATDIPEGPLIVHCQVGLRGHIAERLLAELGHDNVANLTGGYRTWKDAHSI
ncbi:FAD-dependent oxidoreductase [Corynebacterium anserum]|uniref:SidA/IucD/PvdA family monooxygenase n=1 Tax=Corynebacterium anserum TaxID=2684406 RepID=A0A7G7YPV6_9CORY|nr:FAD-dependent oxidoreductase [Corynebacterium anserum]MBC2682175.1 FAD-dependent oxidoreductase [Corynebacterium anserum]QNH96526.1 SidA/IucD/PvdA family monooxygenase [Corynebacterium anserum]